jgi:hypothetical protein
MAYFLTDQQEYELNLFLDEQNRIAYHKQMESDELSDELKEIIKKTEETGSPIPAFDPKYGYYTVSFTPCNEGNRIYAHHHITNQSKAIYDPANNVEIIDDQVSVKEPDVPVNELESTPEEPTVLDDDFEDIDKIIDSIIPEEDSDIDATSQKLTSLFGPPPDHILQEMQLQSE